jgi:hypothetical protein
MSLIPLRAGGNLKQTTKLDAKDWAALRATVAKLQAESLAKGFSIHFTENGTLYELRPDGSRHQIELPAKMNCSYDSETKRPGKTKKA